MNIIGNNFAQLSKEIHTTGGQELNSDGIMWAATNCIKNQTDENSWKFVAELIDKKILEKKTEDNNNN